MKASIWLQMGCVGLAVLGMGCGLLPGSGNVSCDFRKGSVNGAEPRCQEWVSTISGDTYKMGCEQSGGVFATTLCPTEGRVGGCKVGSSADGSTTNDWYYPPETAEQAKGNCGPGETVLNP